MGITRLRARPRRALGIVAAIVAVMAAAAVLAGPAEAASQATFTNLVEGNHATVHGNGRELTAGLMGMTIDGAGSTGYCIDLETQIQPGASGLDEVDWASSGVTNLDVVGRILAVYHPIGDGPGPVEYAITGTNAQKAAATQAAIWYFTDGFELTVGGNDPVIEANYFAILAAVGDGALPAIDQPDVSLSITPPAETSAVAGALVGPYVVSTTAGVVTLTPSPGVTVTDADGAPLMGPIGSGTEFFLLGDAETTATVTASADATVHAGRVFLKAGTQRLILAEPVRTSVNTEVSASWTAPPPTTTPPTTAPPTTAPPETTTTVPQSSTTAPPQTSTTVAIQPNPSVVPAPAPAPAPSTPVETTSESLPRTGSDARPLVAVGVALVAAGAVLGVAARRRRT